MSENITVIATFIMKLWSPKDIKFSADFPAMTQYGKRPLVRSYAK